MTDLENLLDKLQKQTQLSTKQLEQELETSETSQTCNKCDGGWIFYIDEKGCNVAKECSCRKDRIMANRLRFANIPVAFKDVKLQNFNTAVYKSEKSRGIINTVIGIIKAYLADFETHRANGMGLYMSSHTKGSGKTRFSISLANELMTKYNMQVKFSTSTSIINEIKATWDPKERICTETELLSALSTTSILIIDDFGTEKIRDWIDEKFYNIINERYNNKKITIYTSNYQLSELEYDDRIKSRVRERVYEIPFPEESVRDHIANRNNSEMLSRIGG